MALHLHPKVERRLQQVPWVLTVIAHLGQHPNHPPTLDYVQVAEDSYYAVCGRRVTCLHTLSTLLQLDIRRAYASGLLELTINGTESEGTVVGALLNLTWSLEPQFSKQRDRQPEVCQGCLNYHGKSYGGNFLCCAIHPQGPVAATCCDRKTT
ncbi:MAG: hypothetical protein HC886_16590 [Leptolyngbyaceae cyanobacterium SM1_1_3]|nr:hypothetical protein [Leptolyngbyaceae cyanobacterium SM1_1_3]NJM85615.1 hypothetical protein [Leptolyngbyaceae cyanobacterium RM2_2_21]NJN04678.1 hypothetical protein [Leptolyngbyaceae cyanobacterium RM1_1_2]NJO09204.1 hypothetical protein [Leptolyngbyaceae cyanobacterium SL_1_1]